MLDLGNHQIHESPSRRLERQVRAMRPLATWLPAPGFVFQGVKGTTSAKDFGDPLGLVLDYFKGRMRGPELLTTGWLRHDGNITITEDTGTSVSFTRSGASFFVYLLITTEAGKRYDVPWTGTANTSVMARDQTVLGSQIIANETSSFQFEALSDTTVIRLQTADPSASLTVSVREIPGNHLRQPAANSRPTLGIELGSALGPELVVNGDFSDGAGSWTAGTGWSASGGRVVHTGAGGEITQTLTGLTIGATYKYCSLLDATGDTFLSNTSVQIRNSANTSSIVQALSGDLTPDAENHVVLEFVATETTLIVRCFSEDDVSWDSVSVREVLRNGPRSMQFDGLDDFLDATGLTAASGPKTVIAGVVTEDGETDDRQYLLDVEFGRQITAAVGPIVGSAAMFDGNWSGPAAYNTGAPSVVIFKHWATGGGIKINGADVTSENQVEQAYGGAVAVGSNFAGNSAFLKGKICVLQFFDRALSVHEKWICAQWVEYLMKEML